MRDEFERLARLIARGDRSVATAEAYVRLARARGGKEGGPWFKFSVVDSSGVLHRRLEEADWPLEFPGSWLPDAAAAELRYVVPYVDASDVTLRASEVAAFGPPAGQPGRGGVNYLLEARARRSAKVLEVRWPALASSSECVLRGTFDPCKGTLPVALLLVGSSGKEVPVESGVYYEVDDPAAGGVLSRLRWETSWRVDWKRGMGRSPGLAWLEVAQEIAESSEWTRLVREHMTGGGDEPA